MTTDQVRVHSNQLPKGRGEGVQEEDRQASAVKIDSRIKCFGETESFGQVSAEWC